MQRYKHINQIMQQTVSAPDPLQKKLFTEKLDNILLHKIWGYVILLLVLFILFQSIFWIAQYPMNGIDWLFFQFSNWLNQLLPENQWSNFLINGIIAGLNGVLIFVPQIMILFGLITVLEDSGYMTRISFLSDKLTRKVGLNGKSVMPMISGFACAIPAIMSTRSIENKKERLLTILITPFMSCSARLPVFTILISLVIPNIYFAGFLSLQGLVMMALYLFGLIMAFAVSYVLNRLIHIKDKSFFILELPDYRMPRWKNIFTSMLTKAKIFITNAGKVIIIISIILWFLSSYGPKEKMQLVKHKYTTLINTAATYAEKETYQKQYNTEKLENSYAGVIGRTVEPVIQPLGYDWKIGIALITSFAAREIFVGTMSTLYSVEDNNNTTLVEKMNQATREDGTKLYTLATGLSLMMFYLLAMQCMNTLVVVYQETKSLRWPIIQFLYMTGLAYIMSFLVYQIFRS
jgi:ferrous iron transport protein B